MPPANDSLKYFFSLQPFEPTPQTAHLAIKGTVDRTDTLLTIEYWLAGDWERVVMFDEDSDGDPDQAPQRRDRLWQSTCFEFFLASGQQHTATDPYWEFNLSPEGHWNVFSLSGYRQGKTEELRIAALPFDIRASDAGLHLEASLDIGALIAPSQSTVLGVSMVALIESPTDKPMPDGLLTDASAGSVEETFWAITHPSVEPDFHHPDSFAMQV